MKLLAGIALFLLCALAGESRSRRLQRRAQALLKLFELIREIGERQLTALLSFQESALRCPPSSERDALLALLQRSREQTAAEIKNKGQVYRSVGYLTGVAALLLVLQTAAELKNKGQVYRSVGYLTGAAALLLVL